jgi:hypothetical protein
MAPCFMAFSTAVSHRIDQWAMRVIQFIKIFDQTDIKQQDPADDEEFSLFGRADQNLWEIWIRFLWEAWITFLNELEKSRRFANFVKNVGNRRKVRD